MSKTANFIVEGRLTQLLGENYSTAEHALKELVDNAWDANAENVYIALPQSLDDSERYISIKDDGIGMSEDSIENEYLRIARDRISSKGEKTELKNRLVKGRKGIGKFAGLLLADRMRVVTTQNSKTTQFDIVKGDFLSHHDNLTLQDINLMTLENNNANNGTEIILNNIDILSIDPNYDKLRQLLIIEYGREDNFNIFINNNAIKVEDIGGKNYRFSERNYGIELNFNIAGKEIKNKKSGIVLRVKGKIIGKPHYWGVEDVNYIHSQLLKKVYGEVNADFLEKYTTNSWGIVESTVDYQRVEKFVSEKLLFALEDSFDAYIQHTKKQVEKEINKQLEKLPEFKREKALRLINKVLTGLSDGRHNEQQIKNIIAVTISALENDDYYDIIEKIAQASDGNIEIFASALREFGIIDISLIAIQATARLSFLEKLQFLVDKEDTLEKDLHTALEKNMWVFGAEYSLMSSNQTTNHIVDKYLGEKFKGDRANKRPDLLLSNGIGNKMLLIEFKRPSLQLEREHEAQATEYRDDLLLHFPNKAIDILVIGKRINPKISVQQTQPNLKLMSFTELILNARTELEWLLNNLVAPIKE